MSGVPEDRQTTAPPQVTERHDSERILTPVTAEDYLLAAQAWAGGRMSYLNTMLSVGGDDRAATLAAAHVADSAQAQAYAAVAVAMAALR